MPREEPRPLPTSLAKIEQHRADGMTWSEIGANYDVSGQWLRDCVRKRLSDVFEEQEPRPLSNAEIRACRHADDYDPSIIDVWRERLHAYVDAHANPRHGAPTDICPCCGGTGYAKRSP